MLHLHRAERADRLADALAAVVHDPLADPFAAEIVSVPTRGAERWLAQRLSTTLGASVGRSDGVCANVAFPFPGRLITGAVARATGVDPATDPWPPERSVWPLLDVVGDHLDEEWLGALAAHLGHQPCVEDQAHARRFAAVRHLAGLYDHYGVHRPTMIRAWAAGDDADGDGRRLADDVVWQAELWRRLRARMGTASPAERLEAACARLRAEPALIDLPARVSLFGLTRLPASYLDVLRAIGQARDVHLFLLHPSPVLWDRIAASGAATGAPVRRSDDRTGPLAANPLLATWGRDVREMQLVVAADAEAATQRDEHHPLAMPAETVLQRIQADVRLDRPPAGAPLPGTADTRPVLDAGDRTLQVHACHGRARQVEALREAILHLLADDPTLEPRDVIVMCPDIDAFAPLIHATFGVGRRMGDADETHDGPQDAATELRPQDLRVRLADRSIRQTNPVLAVISELLALAPGRLTASHVVDLAGREPVRRRFGFDDDDLARIDDWVATTGIRWGIDAAHRAPFKLESLATGTWRAGLDRVLVGVTMDEEGQRLVGDVLPLDDVDSGDIELAGRVAELLDRLQAAVEALSGSQPIRAWAEAIAAAADALTTTRPADAWQRAQLARLLDDVVAEATAGGTANEAALELDEVRALLADRLRGQPTRANFRTGHLTMCTLVPMRSVPHRVVALLGLDDGEFPRRTAPDGDDLIQRAPRVGDHDPRSEDRQLLLDALLSATQHLVITYTGNDERTNAPHPPAVPLGELLDVIDATVRTADGSPARDAIVIHHPLQPFDPRNFTTGALTPERPWSFDPVALDGAVATTRPRTPRPAFLAGPLPPAEAALIELDDLVRFVQHPTKAFLRQRLGVSLRDGEDEPSDALSVELDNLERWGIGQRLLDARLSGVDAATCRAAEIARGLLPPGVMGTRLVDGLLPEVDGITAVAETLVPPGTEPGSIEVNVDLGGGRRLVGTVGDVFGPLIRTVTYSRLGAKHRLAAWVRLLALTAARPEPGYEAVTIGRGRGGRVQQSTLQLGADPGARAARARVVLGQVVDLYDRGRCEPLPVFAKTSATYADTRRRKDTEVAGRVAAKDWLTDYGSRWDNEDRELEHQLVLGRTATFTALLEAPPAADETGPGWADDEESRFGRLARRLWDPLLDAETMRTR